MREIKFRAWFGNKMIKPMSLQKMIYQKDNTIPLKVLEKEIIFMQYTGYKDKNGKDIYCNDIVINTFLDKQIFIPDTITECAINGFYNYNEITYIVIGNIYENPELLK